MYHCTSFEKNEIEKFGILIFNVLFVRDPAIMVVVIYTTAGTHPIQNDCSQGSRFPCQNVYKHGCRASSIKVLFTRQPFLIPKSLYTRLPCINHKSAIYTAAVSHVKMFLYTAAVHKV